MKFYGKIPRQHNEWMEPDTTKMQFKVPEDYIEPKINKTFTSKMQLKRPKDYVESKVTKHFSDSRFY